MPVEQVISQRLGCFFHNVSEWESLFGPCASHDDVITGFGHYTNWLRILALVLYT